MILVHELIDDLRRFPTHATVTLHDRQILVDATPYERNGNTVFDAQCPDSELPELLRNTNPQGRAIAGLGDKKMNARQLETHEEFAVGEDRVFRSNDCWYWQARGSCDAYGPFASRAEAEDDWANIYNEPAPTP